MFVQTVTDEEIRLVRELRGQKLSFRDISLRMGCKRHHVYYIYNEYVGSVGVDKTPIYPLTEDELPLVTLAGTYTKRPVVKPGKSKSCRFCSQADECRVLTMNEWPVRCEWPLVKEVADAMA